MNNSDDKVATLMKEAENLKQKLEEERQKRQRWRLNMLRKFELIRVIMLTKRDLRRMNTVMKPISKSLKKNAKS